MPSNISEPCLSVFQCFQISLQENEEACRIFFVGCGSPYISRSAFGFISRSEVRISCKMKFKTSSSLPFPSISWYWLMFLLQKSEIKFFCSAPTILPDQKVRKMPVLLKIFLSKDQKQKNRPHWGTESIQSHLTAALMCSMFLGR